MVAISDRTLVSRAHLSVHKERCAAALVFILLSNFVESRHKHLVEGKSRNVSAGVDTESVHTHFNKCAVAIDEVFGSGRVFGVEVHAVAGDLCIPAGVVVPVETAIVVPIVVGVVVFVIGILHQR